MHKPIDTCSGDQNRWLLHGLGYGSYQDDHQNGSPLQWNFANNIYLTIQFYQVWSTSVCREINLLVHEVYYFCLLHSKVTVLEWSQVGIRSKVVTDWSTSRRPQSIAGSVYCLAN